MKPPATKKNRRSIRLSRALVLLCAWLVLLIAVGHYRQDIADWWKLRHYDAPKVVAQLATDDTLTPKARKYLYVNEPQLQPKATFKECNLGTERAAILGCYHSNQAGIFVLKVNDVRLHGIEQVTVAHEMLHAAYDRLSSKQKHSLNALLEDYFHHGLHDQTILDQMAEYQKSEPNDVVDEMHSVFGTEVGKLPSALEQYYAQYFGNRSKVTGFYESYQAEFTTRQATIKADDAQLSDLKTQIDTDKNDLKAQYASLQSRQAQLDSYKQSGQIALYNAGVPGYNAEVAAYNSHVAALKNSIDQYNNLVTARNSVALETQQLSDEISSQVAPIGQ